MNTKDKEDIEKMKEYWESQFDKPADTSYSADVKNLWKEYVEWDGEKIFPEFDDIDKQNIEVLKKRWEGQFKSNHPFKEIWEVMDETEGMSDSELEAYLKILDEKDEGQPQ